MSLIQIFTDPHIGKKMTANTTFKSRKRWAFSLVRNCHNIIGDVDMDVPVVCVGDLFDADQVPAADLLDGLVTAQGCEVVLGGNHDVENSAGSVSALAVVAEVVKNVVMPVFNRVTVSKRVIGKSHCCVFVPHHTSKELFYSALTEAETYAKVAKQQNSGKNYLFLHCNYNCEFANKETELNLSPADAERLLAAGFDRIFIGHDHNRKSDFDGRLQVLGSVSPTSFGDCESEHGFYTLDTVNDVLEYVRTYDPKYHFLDLKVEDLLHYANDTERGVFEILDNFPMVDFIRIKGDIEPSQAVEFSKVVKKLWIAADAAERLFAIKVDARVRAVKNFDAQGQRIDVLNLKSQIRMELESSPDLLGLWDELLGELT